MAENTVRIGLSDIHYAILKEDSKTALAYGPFKQLAPAVSASISPQIDDSAFYADDVAMITNQNLSSIEVEIETADIPDEVIAELLGSTVDDAGVVVDGVSKMAPKIALAFRSQKSNGKYKYVVLHKGSFGIGDDEYATKEDSVSYQTTTITGTFVPTVHAGNWRASVNEDAAGVGATVVTDWFTKVYGSTVTDPKPPTTTTTKTVK